ncbi:MAG: methyltransferase domain-containing protein [Pyrinomonadaceae bacterium]|nr:methyltransferase domain-containing protein [Pyrinomonadaceae bacterium]
MNWNASFYDNSHAFVAKLGEGLLPLLNPQNDENILDLGCGTGDLTEKIAQSGAKVIGIDSSAKMIELAKAKFPNIDFRQLNAIDFELNQQFDAIFSNAVLHWILEKEKVIKQIYSHLINGGRLVAEFGGAENVEILTNALRKTLNEFGFTENSKINFWYFPTIGEYATELEKVGFRVIFAQHYDRPTELKGKDGIKDWLTMFGEKFFVGINKTEKENILNTLQKSLEEKLLINGVWQADYKRIRIIAIKN